MKRRDGMAVAVEVLFSTARSWSQWRGSDHSSGERGKEDISDVLID